MAASPRTREMKTIRSEFTVQVLTVKSLAIMLETKHNLIHIMLDCLFKSFHKVRGILAENTLTLLPSG